MSGHFDTLISGKTAIEGDINFSGGLHVDGRVKGTVRSEEGSDAVLRISEVGEVEGDVYAPRIIINGTVHGNVYASEHLELASKAAIHGNVYYNLIQMAMGASVNGNLLHRKEKGSIIPQPRLTGSRAEDSDSGEEEDAGDEVFSDRA
ncbi:MAG: polymer-forming cytoskeletal protein [Oleiphilaceae bacterium]|nr:polymer-forming cytoskeletal protein [Oleiphilaceae bacterium]